MEPQVTQPAVSHATHASRRIVLAGILVGLVLLIAYQIDRNPTQIPDPLPETGLRAAELSGRIDVNSADWATLAAIPNLGEIRAREIVAYRERVRLRHPEVPAFGTPEDLLKVKGIGYAMMQTLAPHLVFTGKSPAVQPAD